MTENVEIPLHLCQVLEEEFESLHETLDSADADGEQVPAPGGDVWVKSDWGFHRNHVRRGALARRLSDARRRWRQAHPGLRRPAPDARAAERDLDTYLAFEHWRLRRAGTSDAQYLAALRDVLDNRCLFDEGRLEGLRARMRDETRGLAELARERGDAAFDRAGGEASDQKRYRRLLLEDAFPEEIRRAYDLRLARVVRRIHRLHPGRSAICLSGGGIRSGTFALGVLQSLARNGLLGRFDYLSTVSGGGYIGGWLSAWIHRHRRGLSGVIEDLKGEGRASKLEPEPLPLSHLREFSNFITPKTGLLSADSWTFVVIYLRNLLLNWMVLVPLLASMLVVPRVANAVVLAAGDWPMVLGLFALTLLGAFLLRPGLPGWRREGGRGPRRGRGALLALLVVLLSAAALACLRWPRLYEGGSGFLTPRRAMLLFGTLLSGYSLAFMRLSRPSNSGMIRPGSFWDRHREQNSFLWLCLLPLCLSGVLLTTFWAWHRGTPRPADGAEFGSFLLFGVCAGLASLLFYWLFLGQTRRSYRRDLRRARKETGVSRKEAGALEKELEGVKARLKASAEGPAADGGPRPGGGAGRDAARKVLEDERRNLEERLGRVRAQLGLKEKAEKELYEQFEEQKKAVRSNVAREAVSLLVSSLIGALLLWVAATRVGVFDEPVAYREGITGYEWLSSGHWWGAEVYTTLAFPVYLLVIFLGVTLFVGFTSRRYEVPPRERRWKKGERSLAEKAGDWVRHPLGTVYAKVHVEDEDREWLARASAWLFIVGAGWLFFSTLVLFGPLLYFAFEKWLLAAGGLSGLVAILGGRSAGTPGAKADGKGEGWRGALSAVGVNLVVVASFVFFACLVLAVALLTGTVIGWLAQYLPRFLFGLGTEGAYPSGLWSRLGPLDPLARALQTYRDYFEIPATRLGWFAGRYPLGGPEDALRNVHFPTWLYLFALALALHLVGRGFSLVINLNKFSLHAGYRDRIIRAFLGASRPRGERQANPFTGFDPRDELYMSELSPWALREADFEPGGLASFVAALDGARRAKEEGAPPGGRRDDDDEAAAARFLFGEIERLQGESLRFFGQGDPPQGIDTNPSFRSALFGDLGRIMHSCPLEDKEGFKSHAAAAQERYKARLAELRPAPAGGEEAPESSLDRLLLNRMLLLEVFGDSMVDPPPLYRLLHVVNMALNLVGGDRLAWQQRRAESFTSTALHSGSLFVGYRHTREYGGNNGVKLGTAVAVSGAAASSNMGYFSPSPFVTLALTFFNARLGWWLGNPGVHGADTFFRSHPTSALSPILDEAFGQTDDTNPYVLLSDGGHFENLGLYEMVLRRCRYVVVVDGSADPAGSYDDLGGAVRKIRIDFGIDIRFDSAFRISSRPESLKGEKSGVYCAVGDILYGGVDGPPDDALKSKEEREASRKEREAMTGKLIYIKPAVYGDEPRDVFNYTQSNRDFPHEATADQFFDEPQFESHRMLGSYILEKLYAEAGRPATLEQFAKGLGAGRGTGDGRRPPREGAREDAALEPEGGG